MNITELIADLQLHFPASDPKEVAKALLAQQAVIDQMCEALAVVLQCRPIGYETMTEARERKIREALALQPSLTALREHDAEVVTQCYYVVRGAPLSVDGVALTALQVLSIYDQLTLPLRTMAERIRKGVTE